MALFACPTPYPLPTPPRDPQTTPRPTQQADIESALKMQLFVSTALMTPVLYKLCK